uniref:Uncharacterized protein n=1 Tax=Rhizophora mucronata TaxID=61149 RepID=A0A2P2QJP1_RHIMU
MKIGNFLTAGGECRQHSVSVEQPAMPDTPLKRPEGWM